MNENMNANINAKIGIVGIIGLVLFCLFMGGWYTIGERERGVVLRNKAFLNVADSGFHLKLPILDNVVKIPVESFKAEFPQLQSYSQDQQPATIAASVNYHVVPGAVEDLYRNYGSVENMVERVLAPKINKALKEVFGQFSAALVIKDRARFGAEVQLALTESVGVGLVVIESVQVENIDFSNAYEQSVEQRMLAEVEVQKVKQNWEKEKVSADITRTRAQAEADARLAQATAEAKAIELKGAAEATAIQLKGKALRDNPELVSLV